MFRNLSDDVHDQIMKLVDKKSFPPGSNVTKQGSYGSHMYFVKKGTLSVIVDGGVVGQLADDAFFGEWALASADGRRSSTVVAVTRCELFRLSRADFQSVMVEQPMLMAELKSTKHFVVHNSRGGAEYPTPGVRKRSIVSEVSTRHNGVRAGWQQQASRRRAIIPADHAYSNAS